MQNSAANISFSPLISEIAISRRSRLSSASWPIKSLQGFHFFFVPVPVASPGQVEIEIEVHLGLSPVFLYFCLVNVSPLNCVSAVENRTCTSFRLGLFLSLRVSATTQNADSWRLPVVATVQCPLTACTAPVDQTKMSSQLTV